jgi:hypothetical protein
MPSFAFWNTQRLGGSSPEEKRQLFEGIIAQIMHNAHDFQYFALCEVTGVVQIGDVNVEKALLKASVKPGQLAYEVIDADLANSPIEAADIDNFNEIFGIPSFVKGGNAFNRQSKRPVAGISRTQQGTPIFIYHANASARSAFLVNWVAAALAKECEDNFILAGDLNCEPADFQSMHTAIQHQMQLRGSGVVLPNFTLSSGGQTHNAKAGLAKIYDWAVSGSKTGEVKVQVVNYMTAIHEINWGQHASDHLPIVITYA